jgi:hypothetical protein
VLVGERRQPVEGPENIAGAVDEIEMWGRHWADVANNLPLWEG